MWRCKHRGLRIVDILRHSSLVDEEPADQVVLALLKELSDDKEVKAMGIENIVQSAVDAHQALVQVILKSAYVDCISLGGGTYLFSECHL